MHKKLAVTTLALSAFGLAWAVSPAEKLKLQYFDPEDRRVHAAVEAVVVDGRLQIEVSALGAMVEPLPGFRGRAGGNLQTAFEIDQLIPAGRLQVVTFDRNGRRMSSGEVLPGERGRLPVRRLRHDGSIDYHALSAREYLLGFVAGSSAAPLPSGAFFTQLRARGEPRLRVDFYVDDAGNGHLLEFVELGHGESRPKNVGEQFRFVATGGAEVKKEPSEPPVDRAEWQARDLDAKWVLYRKSRDEIGDAGAWVEFLLAEKDYEFLEMLALYEIDAFQLHGIGEKLKQADAPNWIRLAAWMRAAQRGHMSMTIDGLLMDGKTKDVVASWIRKSSSHVEGDLAAVLTALDNLEPKPKAVDVSKYLAPLDAAEMFKWLDAPAELASLGDAVKAEPGVVYLEQVLRTIDALVVSGRHVEPWMGKLEKLRSHANPRVRQAVYLAYTHVGPKLIPASCIEAVNRVEEDALVREAALLAHSYRNHFEVYADLIDVAVATDHPAWRAAVSRLGDLGDGFALAELGKIEVDADEDRTLLTTSTGQIELRLQALEESGPMGIVLPALQRFAWMEATGHPRAEEYFTRIDTEIRRHAGPGAGSIREQLTKLAQSSFAAEKGAGEERRLRFEQMSDTMQRLAAKYAQAEAEAP